MRLSISQSTSVSPDAAFSRKALRYCSSHANVTPFLSRRLLDLLNGLWRPITSVILALDLNHHFLHLFRLPLPLFFAHLLLSLEQLLVRLAIAPAQSVPQCSELAIVVIEVQVVHSMTRSTVNNRRIRNVFPVVDHDSPNLDEGEQRNVGEFLEGEDEWEEVVRHALAVTVERVECVGSVWRWHNPLVVWLVEALVDEWVVQASVDPVDAKVGKHDEHWELYEVVPSAHPVQQRMVEPRIRSIVIDERVAPYFRHEERHCEDGHDGDRFERLSNLHGHLIFEVFRVLEGRLVENEYIAQRRTREVYHQAEDPAGRMSPCPIVVCTLATLTM